MAYFNIALLNQSTVVADTDVAAAVPAFQTQITQHFAPIWGTDASLTFYPSDQTPDAASWQLIILDDADQAGALGYHDLTDQGQPQMKIFAATAQQNNVSWTSVTSHELLEALADPYIDSTVFNQDTNTTGRLWPMEACDPVESSLYDIDGVEVSNFVTPFWFVSGAPASSQFDYLQQVNSPFQIAPGGYMSYFDIQGGSGWQQVNQDHLKGLTGK